MSTVDTPIRAVFDCNVLLQAMANPAGPDCRKESAPFLSDFLFEDREWNGD